MASSLNAQWESSEYFVANGLIAEVLHVVTIM